MPQSAENFMTRKYVPYSVLYIYFFFFLVVFFYLRISVFFCRLSFCLISYFFMIFKVFTCLSSFRLFVQLLIWRGGFICPVLYLLGAPEITANLYLLRTSVLGRLRDLQYIFAVIYEILRMCQILRSKGMFVLDMIQFCE